ncbi:hypothetical protein PO909_032274 [Leuciscus waleckii]
MLEVAIGGWVHGGPGGVFCCCSPSASRLCVLWLHKCFAAYLGCNEWLFQSKLLFYQLESVGPFSAHQQGIFAHGTAAYWMFFPFHTILCKP